MTSIPHLPNGPSWDACAKTLQAAAVICSRARTPDTVDWNPPNPSCHQHSLFRQVEGLSTHAGANMCSPGWDALLIRLFFDMDEALRSSNAPLPAWRWSDVKSKFGALRAYGRLATVGEAALERSLQGLGDSGGVPSWTDSITNERLEDLESRMRALAVGALPAAQNGHWSRRMGLTLSPDPWPGEEARLAALAPALEECSLLSRSAETVLSLILCEMCSGPALSASSPAPQCPHCKGDFTKASGLRSASPIRLPKPALALASLCHAIQRAERETRQLSRVDPNRRAKINLPDTDPDATFAFGNELAPLARMALEGFDVNEDLGRGLRLAHFRWPEVALAWLDEAGCDWRVSDDLGFTPAGLLQSNRPAAWAALEQRQLSQAASLAPPTPRKTL